MKTNEEADMTKSMIEGAIEALMDKHSQLEVQLDGIRLNLSGTKFGVELNGSMTVSVHMREMTDGEQKSISAHHSAQHSV
jgi:hypothetical protein